MIFAEGPLLPQKIWNSSKTSAKSILMTLQVHVHDMNRQRFCFFFFMLKVHDMNGQRFYVSIWLIFHGTMYLYREDKYFKVNYHCC